MTGQLRVLKYLEYPTQNVRWSGLTVMCRPDSSVGVQVVDCRSIKGCPVFLLVFGDTSWGLTSEGEDVRGTLWGRKSEGGSTYMKERADW